MAQRVIKLNENELKGFIKNVLFEMAGFNDDDDELNSVLNKYSKQTAIPTSNNAEATAAEDAAEEDMAAEEGIEGQGEFYIITYNDEITNSTDTWIGDAEEKTECVGDEYQIQGPFPTKEDAEEEARKQGLDPKDLVDDEGQRMVSTDEPADNPTNISEPEPEGPITSLSTQDTFEPETHQEGDVIYYENTPIEYSNGKYHMTIEDGFDMGDAKCPKIIVVGSNLDAVKHEYENLWDNYYYKEHGRYAKDMIERGFGEYDMSAYGGQDPSEIDLTNTPVIINVDK